MHKKIVMEPKKIKEADKDPKIVEPNDGTIDPEEREFEGDKGGEEENRTEKEPYVDFSKLF
jgi:hypothetical protein